jgi:hypothetical protein
MALISNARRDSDSFRSKIAQTAIGTLRGMKTNEMIQRLNFTGAINGMPAP